MLFERTSIMSSKVHPNIVNIPEGSIILGLNPFAVSSRYEVEVLVPITDQKRIKELNL